MKIAINAIRATRQGGGGIDHYLIHLINHLAKSGVRFDLYTLVPDHFPLVDPDRIIQPFAWISSFYPKRAQKTQKDSQRPAAQNSEPAPTQASEASLSSILISKFARALADPLRMAWTQLIFPLILLYKKYDVLFSPSQLDALPFLPYATKQVITVLDIIPFIFKEQRHKHQFYLKTIFPIALKKAEQVIAISENTKKDLAKYFGLPEEKIAVVYLARPEFGDSSFTFPAMAARANEAERAPLSAEQEILKVKEKYKLSQYIFCLSGNHPHKNLPLLIEAFALIKDRTDCSLVIAGYQDSVIQQQLDILVRERGLVERVKFLGHADSQDLPGLYCGAEFFVFPSLYEGFGLPPLEAISYGVPALVSQASSLPEVVGDAGIYFDPKNSRELAEKMEKLLSDENLKNRLRKAGPERAMNFSWTKAARETLNIFEKAAKFNI